MDHVPCSSENTVCFLFPEGSSLVISTLSRGAHNSASATFPIDLLIRKTHFCQLPFEDRANLHLLLRGEVPFPSPRV